MNPLLEYLSSIGRLWQAPALGKIFRSSVFFITLQLLLIFFKFSQLPPQVPLFYSLPWGEARLASAASLFLLPTLSTTFLIVNLSLSIVYLKTIPLFSYLLAVFSLIFSSFSFIALFKIISLVT